MKRFVIAAAITLFTCGLAYAADKWTGPISPIDPMWGMRGSSIMAEALRDRTQEFQQQQQMRRQQDTIRDLEDQLDKMKRESRTRNGRW